MTFATVAVQNRYTAADLSDLSWFWSGADAPGILRCTADLSTLSGRGTLIKDPCNKCHGHGRVERSKTLSVKIPAGVDTGDRIRLAGEGEAGEHGAPAGDLYVQVQVKQHPIFEREGNNLYCEVPINFAMAALGGEIEVPTLDGRVKLKVLAKPRPVSYSVCAVKASSLSAVAHRVICCAALSSKHR